MRTLFIVMMLLPNAFACAQERGQMQALGSANLATDGHEGVNGGDFIAQEAARISGELILFIKQNQETYPEVDVQLLEASMQRTKLLAVPEIIVDGRELDASNNGVNEIRISLSRWNMQTDSLKKMALMFHEYLGVMGLEKDNYSISNRILSPVYETASGQRYSCDDMYNTALIVHYNVLSDLYYFKFDGIDKAAYRKNHGHEMEPRDVDYASYNWSLENCGKAEMVGKKVGLRFERLGACGPMFRAYDQLQFLDGRGIYFSQSKESYSLTCYPIR